MPARRPIKPWTDMRHVWPLIKKKVARSTDYLDPGFQNFGVRVSPKGKCVWFIRHSSGTGKDRKEASGTIGLVQYEGAVADGVNILDLDQAHAAAREWLAEQKDPAYAAQRRAEREAAKARPLTLADGYAEYKKLRRTKTGERLSPRTLDSYDKTWNAHLKKAAAWPLLTTGTRQWSMLLSGINDISPSRAVECMNIVSGIYTHYETMELPGLTRNPIRNVRRLRLIKPPPKRTQHAEPVNLPLLVGNILKLRNHASRDILLCYLLGGFRKHAAMRLRRTIVDLNEGLLTVPVGETGWKGWHGIYPLNSQIAGILQGRAEAVEGDWFFPARHGSLEHIGDVRGSLEIACKGLPVVLRPHDLRRTFGTVCDLMFPGDVALSGALLTHRWAIPESPETSITLSYQQRTLNELRHASETIAQAVLEIAGVLPMSDDTKAALKRKGINPEKLQLIDMSDDTDADNSVEAAA